MRSQPGGGAARRLQGPGSRAAPAPKPAARVPVVVRSAVDVAAPGLAPGERGFGESVKLTLTSGGRLGLKLEDIGGAVEVTVVAEGGQAAQAGMALGDQVVRVGDGADAFETAGQGAVAAFERILEAPRPLAAHVVHATQISTRGASR